MGRTNAKLVPFLKENLEMRRFMNLKFETEIIFYIELPRFDRDRCGEYETILKAWYEKNGKLDKYQGYSNGKSVFQAALKKSVYLMPLPTFGKRLRFRFATPEEIKENKRRLKERVRSNLQPLSPSSDPPSVASSGYVSGNDWETENVQTVSNNYEADNLQTGDTDICMPDEFLEDVLKHPENYIVDNVCLEDLFDGIPTNDIIEQFPPLQNSNSFDTVPHQVMQSEVLEPLHNVLESARPVTELKPIPVGNFGFERKYWICTQKLNVKGMLQLICEMQVVENGSEIKEGSVVIPKGVFEPGESYKLSKSFELNGFLFCFFTPESA